MLILSLQSHKFTCFYSLLRANFRPAGSTGHSLEVRKVKLRTIVAIATLLVVLSLPLAAGEPAAPHASPAPAAAAAAPAPAGPQGGERHPAIRSAIEALEQAKADMQHAAHDFGGHRVAAIKACDEAIKQLREALQYDRK